MSQQIVLASASPRRGELLDQIGVSYISMPVDIDESPIAGETIKQQTLRLALEKARRAREILLSEGTDLPVLGSDTLVEIDGEILGKPADSQHAGEMLAKLSGKTHCVHTAIALVTAQGEYTDISDSEVEFSEINTEAILAYVNTGEPLDKAGAYGIQGIAAQFVRRLSGSYSGVMGLPLYETARLLDAATIKIL